MTPARLLPRTAALWGVALALILSLAAPLPEAAAQHTFGRNKVQYDDFDWHVLKTDHFDIYYYPEMAELAEMGAFMAEEVFDELENKFAFTLTNRVPLIFYASNLHFKQTNVTPGFIPDGVGGFFEFLKGRVVLPANGDLHRFRRVIRHELVHVFTFNKLLRVLRDHRQQPDFVLPLWFTEGLAEYWSGEADHQHEMVMRDAMFSNYLVPLENMYRIAGSYQMYKQGEAICRFISETYGEEKLLELVENAWRDRNFEDVMAFVLREDFDVIAERLADWLRPQYYPALEDVELASLTTDPLAVRGFSGKPTFYRFPDGRRFVYYVGNKRGYSNLYAVEVDSAYKPVRAPSILIGGDRSDRFEAFHLFESQMDVSEDGRLAFVTKSGETDVLHIYDLREDALESTVRFDSLVAVYSPAWSPRGDRLAFSSIDRGGFADLYVYDLGSTSGAQSLLRLTDDLYDDRDPAWHPSGRYLAFASDRSLAGREGAMNLFLYDLETSQTRYVTRGDRKDFAPDWSPSGGHLVFTSTQRGKDGRYGAQDIWVADMSRLDPDPPSLASTDPYAAAMTDASAAPMQPVARLTSLTAAAFDPVWTEDDRIVFANFEHFRFTVRDLDDLEKRLAAPRETALLDLSCPAPSVRPSSTAMSPRLALRAPDASVMAASAETLTAASVSTERVADVAAEGGGANEDAPGWTFERMGESAGAERLPYRRRYKLDAAQGGVSQNAVLGTTGGAVVAFSDMLGDDHLYASIFNTGNRGGRDFLSSLSFQLQRVQLHRRANIGYGIYRFAGQRYDITDPDAAATFPVFFETIYGAFGGVSYPISTFRRINVGSSLAYSDKQVLNTEREALLLSNSIGLVHDNALYGYNGPLQGWRGSLTAAYTTDVLYSNVSYVTLVADVRHYLRITDRVTFASWAMGRYNEGREARLHVIGGSWSLRGFPLFDVRGTKLWFTSHELRFPILNNPTLIAPVLAPFGIANLRGALFFDAAHAWLDDYYDDRPEVDDIYAGETLGAIGAGLRLNLFGFFVLRYDVGYRYRDGFAERERYFRQFFFGYDF